MRRNFFTFFLSMLAIASLAPFACGQALDGSEIRKEVFERTDKVSKLPIEEQLKLRAAEQKAAADPEVKAALEKRDKAIQEFRAAVHASMIKADPTIEPILQKVAFPPKRQPEGATVPPR